MDTPTEALAVSIGEKASVDLPFIAELLDRPGQESEIAAELSGVIFQNPAKSHGNALAGWETADEYLSGNVRKKLEEAREAADRDPSFAVNVSALEKSQPKELGAAEIDVRIGATWIDPSYYTQFIYELLKTPGYLRGDTVAARYSAATGEWNVSGKSRDSGNNTLAYVTYGTKRKNAYSIIEDSLNLRDCRVYDTIHDVDGNEKRMLNTKETMLAQQKQEMVREAFKSWIWKDPARRETLCQKYNEIFNSIKPRAYDGSHITFGGISPEITLRPHQVNAIAHILYGGNTLLAHAVGAGKTKALFDRPEWKQLSESCLGCGTCTFVCPTCQCYDIKEFDSGKLVRRFRCWDSCMYSDFTKMSAGQPRPTQLERFRQRFMHKLVYFPDNNEGCFGCVGCGRCLAKCPIHMNIVKVIKTLGEEHA